MNILWYMQPYGAPAHPSAPLSQHPHLTHGVNITAMQPPLWSCTAPPPTSVLNVIEAWNCSDGTSLANEAQDYGNSQESVGYMEENAAMVLTAAVKPARKKYPNQQIGEGGE